MRKSKSARTHFLKAPRPHWSRFVHGVAVTLLKGGPISRSKFAPLTCRPPLNFHHHVTRAGYIVKTSYGSDIPDLPAFASNFFCSFLTIVDPDAIREG